MKNINVMNGEVRFEMVAQNAYATSNLGWLAGGAQAFNIKVTQSSVVVCGLTDEKKEVETKVYSIADIKAVKISKDGVYSIIAKTGEVHLSAVNDVMRDKLNKLVSILKDQNVQVKSKNLLSKENIIAAAFSLAVIVVMTATIV